MRATTSRGARRGGGRVLAGVMAAALAVGGALLPGCGPAPEEEVVTSPEPLPAQSPFRYPVELWDAGVEGEAVVMVLVTDMGAVDSVYVLESSGQMAFDSEAVAGARTLRFAPGRRGDRRIEMWARLPVRFNRSDTTDTGVTP